MTGLLGREGEARWRIASGVWTGRVFAMLMVAPVLAKIFFPGRGGRGHLLYEGGLTLGAALALLAMAEWLKRGSRVAAVLLLTCFVALKVALWWVGAAKLWDTATGREVLSLPASRDRIAMARFSADGRRIVTCCADGTVHVWSAAAPSHQPAP